MPSFSFLFDAILVGILAYTIKCLVVRKHQAPLPPGPRALPWLGAVFEWPQSQEWLTFSQWSKKYGDMVFTKLYGRPILIVSSARLAFALLETKGSIYSDRASRSMLELSSLDKGVGMVPYGPQLRTFRTMILKTLGTKATVNQFAEMLEKNWRTCARKLVQAPEEVSGHIKATTAAIILHIDYGYTPREGGDDPIVNAALESVTVSGKLMVPQAYLVDSFPILKHIPTWAPGAEFKRHALAIKHRVLHLRNLPHVWVREQMAQGTAQPCFTVHHLSDPKLTPEKEDMIQWASSSMFAAGFDTSASSVNTFFLAMTLHPAVQRRAQAEVDAVLSSGPARLPRLEDRDRLPYVRAVVKEVLRWGVVTPQGLPHRLAEDDVQDGYFIPKGTVVIANVWQMLHDPETYAQPMEFNPDRFMGDQPERDPADFAFGFGRRACPGALLAEASIFVACATMLALFDIQKAKDKQGHEIEPRVEYSSGLVSHPKDFLCNVVSRSERTRALALGVEADEA